MAYFANGTEGAVIDAQCDSCPLGTDGACEVRLVHEVFNYDQTEVGQGRLAAALAILIDDDGICQVRPRVIQIEKARTDATTEVARLGAELQRANLDLAEMALASRPGPPVALMDEADQAAGRRRARTKK